MFELKLAVRHFRGDGWGMLWLATIIFGCTQALFTLEVTELPIKLPSSEQETSSGDTGMPGAFAWPHLSESVGVPRSVLEMNGHSFGGFSTLGLGMSKVYAGAGTATGIAGPSGRAAVLLLFTAAAAATQKGPRGSLCSRQRVQHLFSCRLQHV